MKTQNKKLPILYPLLILGNAEIYKVIYTIEQTRLLDEIRPKILFTILIHA